MIRTPAAGPAAGHLRFRNRAGRRHPGHARAAPGQADTNGDGVIDRSEAAANPRLAAKFDELDKNKDGKLAR